jgi:glucose-1-phosphate cytidylyltransferase
MSDASSPAREIPVVILCGGQGTRLREETEYRPKPMVEIGGKPILWHIMKLYGAQGFRRFVLCLGYKGFMVKQYFLRYHEHVRDFTISMKTGEPTFHNSAGEEDWEVTCAETGLDTYTGTRIWQVRKYLDVDTFMLTYGDGVGDVDLSALLAFHRRHGTVATVTGVRPTSRYGEIEVDGDGRAVEFNEKPTVKEGVVSGGFFVFQRQVFDYLSGDPKEYFEEEPLRRLAREGQLSVYLHEGSWHSMDTYRDYLHLNELWQHGQAPWKIWDR